MRDNDPTLRPAQLVDAAAMKICVEAAYRHYISRIGKIPAPMLDDYSEVVQKHQAFIAEAKGQIVGILVLIRKDNGILLDNVAVHPEHQGKGLGRRLIELAESEARDQGFAHLDLYTAERMTENIELYKRLGYIETERRIEKGYHRVYMRKSLSAIPLCSTPNTIVRGHREGRHMKTAINLSEKFGKFSEHWSPKIIAQMNDYHFKLVKFQGEFVWHDHKDTDEVFIVLNGEMIIHFRDGDVPVRSGEILVIPKGVEHKTSARNECRVMLVEAAGTVNTGDAGGDKTAPTDAWI